MHPFNVILSAGSPRSALAAYQPHARYPKLNDPRPLDLPANAFSLEQATQKATELFDKYAATHADGRLTLTELQQLMREASEEFPHLREHATFLDG